VARCLPHTTHESKAMTTETITCARCAFRAGVWTDSWADKAGGPVCIPCEQEMCGDVEPLAPSVLAAVRDLAPRSDVRTARQIHQWAANLWFNRSQAQTDYATGKRPWEKFAADVIQAVAARIDG
jgi:hypothetical protein